MFVRFATLFLPFRRPLPWTFSLTPISFFFESLTITEPPLLETKPFTPIISEFSPRYYFWMPFQTNPSPPFLLAFFFLDPWNPKIEVLLPYRSLLIGNRRFLQISNLLLYYERSLMLSFFNEALSATYNRFLSATRTFVWWDVQPSSLFRSLHKWRAAQRSLFLFSPSLGSH